MKAVTVGGSPYYLLPYEPDWSQRIVARFAVPGELDRGLTGREAFIPRGRTLRVASQRFTLFLEVAEAAELRTALKHVGNTPVLCPFWPGAASFYNRDTVYAASSGEVLRSLPGDSLFLPSTGEMKFADARLRYTFNPDGSAWEIHSTWAPVSFPPVGDAITVPLLVGRIDPSLDSLAMVSSHFHSVPVEFVENSALDYALLIRAQTFSDGPALDDRTPLLFPLLPDWGGKANSFGGAFFDIVREQVGQTRETSDAYYPQLAERDGDFECACVGWDEIALLLRFFQDHLGAGQSFWIPGHACDGQLTADPSAASAVIHVDDVAAVADNYAVALLGIELFAVRKVAGSDAEAGTVTLDSSPGDLSADEAMVSPLLLARFRNGEIEVTWQTGNLTTARIQVVESPVEVDVPDGETVGETLGGCPVEAFLYRWTQNNAGTVTTYRFTSYERAIAWGAEDFAVQPHEHDVVTETLEIDTSTTAVKTRTFAGNPLALLWPFQLEGPLELEILKCWPDSAGVAGSAETIFRGRVAKPKTRGPFLTAEINGAGILFERKVPHWVIQPRCPVSLFSPPCGLSPATWKFTAVVVSYAVDTGATLVLGTFARTAGVPTLAAHYFAGGWVEFGTGAARQARSVYDSAAIDGSSHVTLTLGVPFATAPAVGAAVSLYPGCDGAQATCKDKFANYRPAGGKGNRAFYYVPKGNPTFVAIPSASTGGKK